MKLQPEHYLMIAAAAAGLYIVYSAKQGVKAVAAGLDITSADNFAASGVNAVGKAVSGDEGWSLGGWWHEKTQPDELKYLGYPSKFVNGQWLVLVDGKWIVDKYQTAQAQKSSVKLTPARATP